ncbi:MAG TPA: zinc-ribbon domain-containing protein, partial [Hyphomicrobiales bacterium]|nr:zinc-ribbon domain-containing protein [Hyphomicrobiales bacterium]
MIIECPACHTRYDIKAVIPPEGRTVRCAKCTNVWRATPQMRETENASETDTADSPATAANQAGTQPEMQSASKADEEKADEESKESGFALHRFGNGSSGHPASQETEPAESQTEIAAPPASLLAAQDTAADEGNERFGLGEADNGKIRWFSSFRRKAKQDPPRLQQGNDEAPGIAAGQTIPFRLNADGEATGELNTLEDARQAVRGVFAGLGDVRPQAHGRLFTQPSAVQASQRDGESQAEVSEPFSFTSPFNDATGFTETEASQDSFEEQTRTAMQSHFTGPPTEDELTQELETHFRSNATAALDNGEGTESLNAFWNRARVPVKELLDEPSASEDEAGTGKDDAAFDERLYREIEHRQEQFGETRGGERRGGLALLAGWGLFLCTASGLLIGLFAFRDITADALPG